MRKRRRFITNLQIKMAVRQIATSKSCQLSMPMIFWRCFCSLFELHVLLHVFLFVIICLSFASLPSFALLASHNSRVAQLPLVVQQQQQQQVNNRHLFASPSLISTFSSSSSSSSSSDSSQVNQKPSVDSILKTSSIGSTGNIKYHQETSTSNTINNQQQQQQQRRAKESSREIEKQIVDKILGEGYDKRIRPAGSVSKNQQSVSSLQTHTGGNGNVASSNGTDGPTVVKVNTLVRSISKIDDVTMEYSVQLSLRQEWTDQRLAFNKLASYKDFNINSITLTEQERLWKPDLFFRNEKEGHFHKIIMPNVLLRISGDGDVLYSIRISLVLACPMDLKYYPLDKQNCTIEMASYGYLDSDLQFVWKAENPVQIAKPLNLPRFALETHETAICTSRTNTGAYSCLRIDLIFKREFSYYLIQIYIPCCMLVIVSWVSFWLDPNAIPARVSLGVTTLLTMATQISGINASLPPVSYTKAIDVWTGVCLTFVFGALLEFALVNYASRSDQHKREMLTKALSRTAYNRWRDANAAAAANGVAPPTSPPYDANSPSAMLNPSNFGPFDTTNPSQQFFFSNTSTLANCNSIGLLASRTPAPTPLPTAAAAAITNQMPLSNAHHHQIPLQQQQQLNQIQPNTTTANSATNFCTLRRPQSTAKLNGGILGGSMANHLNNSDQFGAANGSYRLLLPRQQSEQQHLEAQLAATKKGRKKNWCQAWLAKFPTRSKRIDVISRIFFPLMFALFNLVYWTTYLFREEDTVV